MSGNYLRASLLRVALNYLEVQGRSRLVSLVAGFVGVQRFIELGHSPLTSFSFGSGQAQSFTCAY